MSSALTSVSPKRATISIMFSRTFSESMCARRGVRDCHNALPLPAPATDPNPQQQKSGFTWRRKGSFSGQLRFLILSNTENTQKASR